MHIQNYIVHYSNILIFAGNELYVCDYKGHKVVVFNQEGEFLRSFGNSEITVYPNCIDVFGEDMVLIGNSHGNYFHIAVYSKWGRLLAEYKCPYKKVCIPI